MAGFSPFQFRSRKIEHLRGLHVRRLPENLHQLRTLMNRAKRVLSR